MNTYNEIFLPIELNKALQTILSNVHHYYRNRTGENDLNEEALKKIYQPIFDYPIIQDNIVWFNAWSRKNTEKPSQWFIKGYVHKDRDNDDISRKIINIYDHERSEYSQYVSSLSSLAKYYGVRKNSKNKNSNELQFPYDYAYLITIKNNQQCDIEMASEYTRDFFVYLNFEEVSKLFPEDAFDKHYQDIKNAFEKEEDGREKIIEILKTNYNHLIEKLIDIEDIINLLTHQLSSSWWHISNSKHDLNTLINSGKIFINENEALTMERHKNNIIRLINYYFWVKLAYREWQILLYLPGIITKRSDGIPLGVNIGLKEMVPLETILFFKRAVLLFFTRESVDYFEKDARETARITDSLNKLLTDFQHTLLQKVMETILWCGKEMRSVTNSADLEEFYTKPFTNLCHHIMLRGNYLDKLASYVKDEGEQGSTTQSENDIERFVNSGVFVNSEIVGEDDFKKSLKNWRDIVKINLESNWKVKTHSGAIETILENLLHNSLIKHLQLKEKEDILDYKSNNFLAALRNEDFAELRNYFDVRIILGKQDGLPFLEYYDTGKGFKLDDIKNLARWLKMGPSDEEKDKGYAYWLIGRILKHIEADIKFTILTKNLLQIDNDLQNYCKNEGIDIVTVNRDDLKFDNLLVNNLRVIHRFIFKSGQ